MKRTIKPEPRELWTLHVKVGNRRWQPTYFMIRWGKEAERDVKMIAKHMSDRFRHYRAVKYVPARYRIKRS